MRRQSRTIARVMLACLTLAVFGGAAAMPSGAAPCGIQKAGARADAVWPGLPRGVSQPSSLPLPPPGNATVPRLPWVFIDVTAYTIKTSGGKGLATIDVAGIPQPPPGQAGAAWVVHWSIGAQNFFAGMFQNTAGTREFATGTYDPAGQAYRATSTKVTGAVNKTTISMSWPATQGFPTKTVKASGAYSMNTAVAPWLPPVAAVLYHDAVPANSVPGADKGPGGKVGC